jgi:MYXO-CTERM domain-containing protein
MFRTLIGVGVVVLAVLTGTGPAAGQTPSYFDSIGYTDLRNRLGAATPTGAGVLVTQVEALAAPNAYLPDPTAFPGKTIIDQTGGGLVSGHATTVGQYFYGNSNQSIAAGITQINAYRVNDPSQPGDWLGDAYLRYGTTLAPRVDPARVQNHSYIDTDPPGAAAAEVVRRLDYAIARDNVIAVVGVNNGVSPVPTVQSGGYNSIAVGLTSGNSSVGPTTFDVAGRSKPDIVAPLGATSFATPVVGAAAALLVQTADSKPNPSEAAAAGRVETIKAALLSGATVAPFAGLAQPWQRTDNGSFVEPLDRRFGAGQLNINNSHLILSAARQNGTDLVADARTGWDFATLTAVGQTRRYYFDAPSDATAATLSATVTWLRRIPQSGPDFTTATATLADFELRVFATDQNLNLGALLDSSLSPVDNVQHTRTDLMPAGHYALEVRLASFPTGQSSEDFAVAWQVSFTPVPDPGGALLVAVVGAAAVWRRRTRGRLGE